MSDATVTSQQVISELVRISDEHGGLLRPEDMVEEARPSSSVLHPHIFNRSPDEAAEQYYLEQAKRLIRITVQYMPVKGESVRVRVFQSLSTDRHSEGGYRTTVSILSSADYRKQLLADAMKDLEVFERRYRTLQELADVFSAIRMVKRKVSKRRRSDAAD